MPFLAFLCDYISLMALSAAKHSDVDINIFISAPSNFYSIYKTFFYFSQNDIISFASGSVMSPGEPGSISKGDCMHPDFLDMRGQESGLLKHIISKSPPNKHHCSSIK